MVDAAVAGSSITVAAILNSRLAYQRIIRATGSFHSQLLCCGCSWTVVNVDFLFADQEHRFQSHSPFQESDLLRFVRVVTILGTMAPNSC